jgi:hypothetical protein
MYSPEPQRENVMNRDPDNPYQAPTAGDPHPAPLLEGRTLRVVLASAALALFVLSLLLPWGGSAVGWSVIVDISTQVWGARVDEVVLFFPLLLSSAALLIVPILMLTALKDRKIWTLIPVCLILLCGHARWVLIGKVFSFPNGFFI